MRRGPPWAVIGAADYDFDQCRLAARSGRMRESFAADGNDLAGHQGGVICGGIFAYRALARGIAMDYRGSLCVVLRVLCTKEVSGGATTYRLDFSSTRSLGRVFRLRLGRATVRTTRATR